MGEQREREVCLEMVCGMREVVVETGDRVEEKQANGHQRVRRAGSR